MLKAVIFDFDGVIEQTFEICYTSYKLYEQNITREEFLGRYMGSFWKKIESGKKPLKKNAALLAEVHRRYGKKLILLRTNHLITEAIEELSKNYSLFIISSGCEKAISNYLKVNKLSDYFSAVLGYQTALAKTDKFQIIFKKFDLKSNECLFVTDTLGDILEANEAEVRTIAVNWGFHNSEILSKGKPYKIIEKYDKLLPSIINSSSL